MIFSLKSFASWLFLLLIVVQFVPLNRINPPVISDISAPVVIKSSLKKACYDCHSCETQWRGWAFVAPISWLLSATVSSGRSALNFSKWENGEKKYPIVLSHKIFKAVSDGQTHQPIYYLLNREAQLTYSEHRSLLEWSRNPGE